MYQAYLKLAFNFIVEEFYNENVFGFIVEHTKMEKWILILVGQVKFYVLTCLSRYLSDKIMFAQIETFQNSIMQLCTRFHTLLV